MYRYAIAQNILSGMRFAPEKNEDGTYDIGLTFKAHYTSTEFINFLSGHFDFDPAVGKDGYALRLKYKPALAGEGLVCSQSFIQLLSARYGYPASALCHACADDAMHEQLHAACTGNEIAKKLTIFDDPASEDLLVTVGACNQQAGFCSWLNRIYECETVESKGDGSVCLKLVKERFSYKKLNKAKDVVDLALAIGNAWNVERYQLVNAIEPQVARDYADTLLSLRPAPTILYTNPENHYSQDIIYVGGGFTGFSAIIQNLRRLIDNPKGAPIRIRLIEQKWGFLGGGLAYGGAGHEHDVNVQAQYLSVDPDNPNDFVDWLKAVRDYKPFNAEDARLNIPGFLILPDQDIEETAVQRRLYQYYLLQRFHHYVNTARRLGLADVEIIIDKVTGASIVPGESALVRLESERTLNGTHLVMTTGHGPSRPPRFIAEAAAAQPHAVFTNQWDQRYEISALFSSADVKTVMVLGTGLSAMDVIKTAQRQGFLDRPDARLILVSRGGNLHPVLDGTAYIQPDVLLSDFGDLPKTVGDVPDYVLRAFEQIKNRGEGEIGRPYKPEEVTHALMTLIPEFVKKSGLNLMELMELPRKYSSLINVNAVTMTAIMGGILDEYKKLGRIEIIPAEPSTIEKISDYRSRVDLKDKGVIETDAVISTLPPQSRPEDIPIYNTWLQLGLIQKETQTGIGIEVDYRTMQVINRAGETIPNFAICGPIVAGEAMQQGRIGPGAQTVSGLREQARAHAAYLEADRQTKHRPCVAILSNSSPDDRDAVICARWKHAMESFGIQVILIPPGISEAQQDVILDGVNGVLLTGGDANVHPQFYGQEPMQGQRFDPRRTSTALRLARGCHKLGIPLLGICLGSQEINVALGGTLQQYVAGHDHGYVNPESRDDIAHNINIVGGGVLSQIFKDKASFGVTSVHRQGYTPHDLSPQLRVEALDDSGTLVEAFSAPGHPFLMGTQFHVEFNPLDANNRAIFLTFAKALHDHFVEKRGIQKNACVIPILAWGRINTPAC